MPPAARVILHVDMDAFYAAVEQRDDPALRGCPVLVGGRSGRGVVTTASYEARVFGCRSAMPTAQALRLCPHAIVVKPRMSVYAAESRRVRAILDRFSPDVEPVSIDEAFVDLTNVPTWRDQAPEAARRIKAAITSELALTATVGVASNKFLAKVASDAGKPDGLTVIADADAARVLAPMSVGVLLGIGPVARRRLEAVGVRTVQDLLNADTSALESALGMQALAACRRMALGYDDRPVHTSRTARSIGKERTFHADIADPAHLRAVMLDELEHAARTLREDRLLCRRVALKLRLPDFTTFARSLTLAAPTDTTTDLRDAADRLLTEFLSSRKGRPCALRLLGVRLEDLTPASAEPGLFDAHQKAAPSAAIDAITDRIAHRFGHDSIKRGAALGPAAARDTEGVSRHPRQAPPEQGEG